MARSPDPAEFDRPLTSEQLARRKRELSMLSPGCSVAKAYREAHDASRMTGERVPGARAVQELVTAWRGAVEVETEATAGGWLI